MPSATLPPLPSVPVISGPVARRSKTVSPHSIGGHELAKIERVFHQARATSMVQLKGNSDARICHETDQPIRHLAFVVTGMLLLTLTFFFLVI